MAFTMRLPWLALFSFYITLSSALSGQEPLKTPEEARGYNAGEPIPVSCLNRTMCVFLPVAAMPPITNKTAETQVNMYVVSAYPLLPSPTQTRTRRM
jgi:hypothetical protein